MYVRVYELRHVVWKSREPLSKFIKRKCGEAAETTGDTDTSDGGSCEEVELHEYGRLADDTHQ